MQSIIIITRTFNRPKHFTGFMNSILGQDFDGRIVHLIMDQNPEASRYAYEVVHPLFGGGEYQSIVYYNQIPKKADKVKILHESGGKEYPLYHAPWNLHLKAALERVQQMVSVGEVSEDSIIMYLDDDDKFMGVNDCQTIADNWRGDMMFWRVKFASRLVPYDHNFKENKIVRCDLSMIGFAHSVKMIPYNCFDEWALGDYRTAKSMDAQSSYQVWIDKAFTGLQRPNDNGLGKGDDK